MADKQNLAKESQLALKQDKLIAGANITIALDGKTISAANPTSVTITPVYQAGTLVAAIVVNGNTTNIYAPAQHGDNANQNLAVPFSAAQTYEVGDFVIYQENLYQCITAISTPAAWDSTKWTHALITDVMGQGSGGDYANQNIANTYSTASTYDVGDYVIFNGLLYKCITAVTTPGSWNATYWERCVVTDEIGGGGLDLPDNWSLDEEALTVMALDDDLNELGWKVEDDTYYFDTAANFSLGNRTYTKNNAKPALGGVIGNPEGFYDRSIVMVSTDASATHYYWSSYHNEQDYTFTYQGHTWYYSGGNGDFRGTPNNIEVISDDTLTLEQAAKYLIDYSQVSFTDNRFTTMNQPGSGILFAGGGEESDLSDTTFKVETDGTVHGTDFKVNNISILNAFTGSDGTNAGIKGMVPAPTATDNTKFLRGDGTWAEAGGGGEGGGSYSAVDLWTGPETPTTTGMNITLSNGISNYDMIYFIVGSSSYDGADIYFPAELTIGDSYIGTIYGPEFLGAYWTYTSDTQINIKRQASGYPVQYNKVVGIKFGGGGSSVIPNPQDPATDTLTTVEINGTVYDIVGSGGNGYSETNLYTASSTSFIDIPLTWSWTDYDAYLFFCNDINAQTGNPWFISQGVLTSLIGTQNTLTFYPYDNAGVNYYVTTTQLTAQWHSQGFYIRQIVGLNFSGGGGSASHDYSTSEQVVGTWIDGSTVYENTITISNTSTAYSEYTHGISNIDKVWIDNGYAVSSDGNISTPVIGYTSSPAPDQFAINVTKVKFYYRAGSDVSGGNAYITLRYTKST